MHYAIVHFINDNFDTYVPVNWIKDFYVSQQLSSINHSKEYLCFFSNDLKAKPNFDIHGYSKKFHELGNRLYLVTIKEILNKKWYTYINREKLLCYYRSDQTQRPDYTNHGFINNLYQQYKSNKIPKDRIVDIIISK